MVTEGKLETTYQDPDPLFVWSKWNQKRQAETTGTFPTKQRQMQIDQLIATSWLDCGNHKKHELLFIKSFSIVWYRL